MGRLAAQLTMGVGRRITVAPGWCWPLIGGVSLGLLAGLVGGWGGPVASIGLALVVPVAAGLLVEPRLGLLLALTLVALLPYAVLPVRLALTPSLLTLTALATLGVWLVGLLLDRRQRLRRTPIDLPWLLLLAASLFAFVTGLERGYTSQTWHDFAKLVVAMLLALATINLLRPGGVALLFGWLVAATGLAAGLGLALYAGGAQLTEAVLLRLVPLGYPSGRIVRWIEDDPLRPMRLTSTGVDPNSFGGLLMIGLMLALGQALAGRRWLSRWLTWPAVPLLGLALLLTQSRGAWVGVAAGLLWLAVVRYRRLLPLLLLLGLAVVGAGLGGDFVERFTAGLRFEDPATRLRLAEYQNALAIIRDYPVFGVGFGQAPSIDLQTGVSSVYLTIGSRMGLVGLGCFLWLVVSLLLALGRAMLADWSTANGELLLTVQAALLAGLTAGLFDHYFFNIEFSHMAALFWQLVGGGLALAAASGDDRSRLSGRPVLLGRSLGEGFV